MWLSVFITETTSETATIRISTAISEVSTPTEDHTAEGGLELFYLLSVGISIE